MLVTGLMQNRSSYLRIRIQSTETDVHVVYGPIDKVNLLNSCYVDRVGMQYHLFIASHSGYLELLLSNL